MIARERECAHPLCACLTALLIDERDRIIRLDNVCMLAYRNDLRCCAITIDGARPRIRTVRCGPVDARSCFGAALKNRRTIGRHERQTACSKAFERIYARCAVAIGKRARANRRRTSTHRKSTAVDNGRGIHLTSNRGIDERRTAEQSAVEVSKSVRRWRSDARGIEIFLREMELAHELAVVSIRAKDHRRGRLIRRTL